MVYGGKQFLLDYFNENQFRHTAIHLPTFMQFSTALHQMFPLNITVQEHLKHTYCVDDEFGEHSIDSRQPVNQSLLDLETNIGLEILKIKLQKMDKDFIKCCLSAI
jgi:hypothetical protein